MVKKRGKRKNKPIEELMKNLGKKNNEIDDVAVKKKDKKVTSPKNVKSMNRDELLHYATSVAQHSNKTIREFVKAGKGNYHTPGRLLDIAEKHGIKTKSGRVSRSFKKMSDNQLRDFIVEARHTYTGNTVKAAIEQFNKRKNNTIEMLKTRFDSADIDRIRSLSDEDFSELYARLNSHRASDGKAYNSNEVIVEFLKDFNALNESKEDEFAIAFQKQKESNERLNRNKAVNRNRGRKR